MKDPVVAVALSGGVDSLVSGYLLKQKFRHIFGIHFKTGYEKEPTNISNLEKQLGFPVTCIDLSDIFEKKVISYFMNTYLSGKTPNPCVVCNKEIKFGALLERAADLGADYLATGHYATAVNSLSKPDEQIITPFLEKAFDLQKDQSYFLSMLKPSQIEKVIFPLSGMTKEKVKQFAKDNHIHPLTSGESQDICFIQEDEFASFIKKKMNIDSNPGPIVDMDGKILGQHKGLLQYTIGQRRGIHLPAKEAYYVKRIDIKNNILEVCFKKDLSQKSCQVEEINWNSEDKKTIPDIITKIRYSHPGALSTLLRQGSDGTVVFDDPQNAVTPGQVAVFYDSTKVMGAGMIR